MALSRPESSGDVVFPSPSPLTGACNEKWTVDDSDGLLTSVAWEGVFLSPFPQTCLEGR